MNTLNNEEITNLLRLVNRAQVSGSEVMVVANIITKLNGMMTKEVPVVEDKKSDE